MELRISEHAEPSHIHVPRPSHAERGRVQLESPCPADICAQLDDQREERIFTDTD